MVYGIFSGEYSDWTCEGYFGTKEEAKLYCDNLNRKYQNDNYYVKVLYNLAEGADRESKKAYIYLAKTGKYERSPYNDDGLLVGDEPRVYLPKWGTRGEERAVVFVKDDDAHKVPKIAQDAIAKYRAKKAGL